MTTIAVELIFTRRISIGEILLGGPK